MTYPICSKTAKNRLFQHPYVFCHCYSLKNTGFRRQCYIGQLLCQCRQAGQIVLFSTALSRVLLRGCKDKKYEVGSQRSEVGCQKFEVGCLKSEVGGRKLIYEDKFNRRITTASASDLRHPTSDISPPATQ